MTHGNLGDLTNVLEGQFDLGPRIDFEVLEVELHGVISGNDDLFGGILVAECDHCHHGAKKEGYE